MDINIHSSDADILSFMALAQEGELTEISFDFDCFVVVCAALIRTGRAYIHTTDRRRTKLIFEGVTIREKNIQKNFADQTRLAIFVAD